MNSMATIVNWNCRGFRSNFTHIHRLISDTDPLVVCLQETKFSANSKIGLPKFTPYIKNCTSNQIASGGVAILVRNDIIQEKIDIRSNLQVVGVSATIFDQTVYIVCIYLPGDDIVSALDIENVINQIPAPCIIVGDFNAHNTMWGCNSNNSRGNMIEKVLMNSCQLSMCNDGRATYSPSQHNQSQSAIDLTFVSPTIQLEYHWDVLDDEYGSDHFPTTLMHSTNGNKIPRPRKWIMSKAQLEPFQESCLLKINDSILDSIQPMKEFTDILHGISSDHIPRSSATPKHCQAPWFDDECKESLKEKRRLYYKYKRHSSMDNFIALKAQKAKLKRLIKQKKRESWETYVSKLSSDSGCTKVWDQVKKISGKHRHPPLHPLKSPDGIISSTVNEIAECLADTFEQNSKSKPCNISFPDFGEIDFDIGSNGDEFYNQPFSIGALKRHLSSANSLSAPGADNITFAILKLLPQSALNVLLKIFNLIWTKREFPSDWREAIIIPILKAGQALFNPLSFRPISLLSCICKLFEKMVNAWEL